MQCEYKTIAVPPIAGRVWTAIALTVGILSFASCFKPSEILQPRIQGSVFIVKADGESVRLALTDIYLVPSAAATDELITSIKELLKHLRFEESSIDYNSRPSTLDRGFSSPERAQEARDERTRDAFVTKSSLVKRLAELRSTLVVAAVNHTKADADGEFELLIPANIDTSIFAYATRKIAAHSEHYYWIVPSDEALKQKPQLFLSNDTEANLIGFEAEALKSEALVKIFESLDGVAKVLSEGQEKLKAALGEDIGSSAMAAFMEEIDKDLKAQQELAVANPLDTKIQEQVEATSAELERMANSLVGAALHIVMYSDVMNEMVDTVQGTLRSFQRHADKAREDDIRLGTPETAGRRKAADQDLRDAEAEKRRIENNLKYAIDKEQEKSLLGANPPSE